jgi:hypothetical protein
MYEKNVKRKVLGKYKRLYTNNIFLIIEDPKGEANKRRERERKRERERERGVVVSRGIDIGSQLFSSKIIMRRFKKRKEK